MCKWDAKEYSRNSGNQKRWARGLLVQIRLRGDESVLDVGCGDGKITAMIARKLRRGKVLGVDNSRDMVDFAANFFRKQHKKLNFVRKDACRLGMRDAFDVAFSNSCFHWIPHHRALLKSIHRALKPGGRLFVRMGATGNFAGMIRAAKNLNRREKWRRYFKGFKSPFCFADLVSFRALLKRCGFKVKTFRPFVEYMKYADPRAFKDSLCAIWMPYSHRVPKRLREEYMEETILRYLKDCPPDRRGQIKVRMQRLEFQAKKPGKTTER